MRLPGSVVGILPENDRLDRVIIRDLQRVKDVVHLRVDRVIRVCVLRLQKRADTLIVFLFELVCKQRVPFVAERYHSSASGAVGFSL